MENFEDVLCFLQAWTNKRSWDFIGKEDLIAK